MARKRLDGAAIRENWSGIAGALEGALAFCGEPVDRATVMGVSGHAFRLAIHADTNGIAGPESAMYFDQTRALMLYANLGYTFQRIAARPGDVDFAQRRQELIVAAKRSIDHRRPAIVYGLHLPEYGLVKGYDEAAQSWYVSSAVSGQFGETLPLAQWPAPSGLQWLEALILDKRRRVRAPRQLHDALTFAVAYAEGGDPGGPDATAHGFAAYDRWLAGYAEPGRLDAFGNARNIQLALAARRDAAAFLRASVRHVRPSVAAGLQSAAMSYAAEALAFSRLATLFPYPNGGNVESAGPLAGGAAALRQAQEHERAAVAILREAVAEIEP